SATSTAVASSSSSTGAGGEAASSGIGGGAPNLGGCSSDLHSVLDGNGDVVATCTDDEGCADGACVPACEAAAKSHGNLGCDFEIPPPSAPIGWETPTFPPPCYAVFVANAWPGIVKLNVERGGEAFDPATFGRIPNSTPQAGSWPALPPDGILPDQVAV